MRMSSVLAIVLIPAMAFAQVHFSEDFEGGNLSAAGWISIDADGDGQEWFFLCSATNPHSGSCNMTSASWNGGTLYPDNYAITPLIDLSMTSGVLFLEWFAAAQDQSFSSEHYEVKVSVTGTAVDDFTTTLFSETLVAGGPEPGNYWQRSVDLSAYAGQTVYIAFVHTDCAGLFRLNIDDVSVYENLLVDAALVGVSTPSNAASCSLSASETVTVMVQNNGGLAITDFDVWYSVDAGPTVTETVSATTVAPATSHDYTFAQSADLSTLGYHSITAGVILAGDSVPGNDSNTVAVSSTDANIDVEVQSDSAGGQAWEITDTSNAVIGTHGEYQWNITETTRVCVIDDDCYVFNWTGGTTNTVTVSYNGTLIDQRTATGDYSIDVGNPTVPVAITCPPNQVLDADANCQASLEDYSSLAGVTASCVADPVIGQAPLAGTIIAADTAVSLLVTDGLGGSDSCGFVVELNDGIDPSISCPGDQQQVADPGSGEAILAEYTGLAVADDNCDSAPVVSQSPPPGTAISSTTPVVLTVNDASGNSDDCSFDVDVLTPIADLAIAVTDNSCYVLPGDPVHYMVTVDNHGPSEVPSAHVTDSPPPELTVTSWHCSPLGAAACGAASGIGDLSDRPSLPPGDGVVYTVHGSVSVWASGQLMYSVHASPGFSHVVDPVAMNDSATDLNALEMPLFCDSFDDGTTDAWGGVVP